MSAHKDQANVNLATLARKAAQELAERGQAYALRGRSSMPVRFDEIGPLLAHYRMLDAIDNASTR